MESARGPPQQSRGAPKQQKQVKQAKQQPPQQQQRAPKQAAAPAGAQKKKKAGASAPTDTYTTTRLDGHALSSGTDSSVSHGGIETDSGRTARLFFEWLIYPMSIESFYADYFEKKPLYISRREIDAKLARATLVTTRQTLEEMVPVEGAPMPQPPKKVSNKPATISTATVKTRENALPSEQVTVVDVQPHAGSSVAPSHYYADWFSIPDVHALLRQPELDIQYRRDVDITRYRDGVRTTLNPQGRATEEEVKKFVSEECSLRFLCPQKYSSKLWAMLSRLDEFFGMQTGANSYYTPKGTQGFAPHFDDVDVFVIQTEGSKRWRLYPPRAPTEILPAVSSPNFAQADIGTPVMDVLLSAGDFLYAPRGTIHQCVASVEEASLHVTLSTCLETSWSQYLSILLPRALQLASDERIDFRRSLPHGYDRFMGVMNSDRASGGRREKFMEHTIGMLEQMMELELLPFDAAADQMATDFMHGRVPPPPPSNEKHRKRTVVGAGATTEKAKKSLFQPHTCLRLVRGGVARITTNARGDSVSLHHTLANSRLYKDAPLAAIEYPIGYAPTLETLLTSYPKYCRIDQLPPPVAEEPEDEDDEIDAEQAQQDLIDLVEQLFDEGVIEVTNDAASVPEELRKADDEDEEEEEEEDDDEEEFEDDAEMMEGEEDEDEQE